MIIISGCTSSIKKSDPNYNEAYAVIAEKYKASLREKKINQCYSKCSISNNSKKYCMSQCNVKN